MRSVHTSGVAVVTPNARPKLVRNRGVIEIFDDVCVFLVLLFGFSADVGAFVM